ncbi:MULTISPECIES: hypothetical protein [unclassified Streptomyces]|uniref:hypothetical protein n=1 Tax=unclassified Streptomyces TaxID=2593676 RepID=UPI001F1BD4BE|nr:MULTISPECIES: hypothetical protein [unclassified Streptomyces]MCF0086679.1 hypothetical protein [Streptomyces sp. MH192]MCF0098833.1 hypothetical protein [Streptomyces sp. MH191]
MTVFLLVIAGGALLHATANRLTRAPGDDRAPLRWTTWHSFLSGAAAMLAACALYALAVTTAGVTAPYWAVLLAADVLGVGWKVLRHRHRARERATLQAMFDQPSYREGA